MEKSEKMVRDAMSLFMKMNYPRFCNEHTLIVDAKTSSSLDEFKICRDKNYDEVVCRDKNYDEVDRFALIYTKSMTLYLVDEMYNKLKAVFGNETKYIVDWFNDEFKQNIKELQNILYDQAWIAIAGIRKFRIND